MRIDAYQDPSRDELVYVLTIPMRDLIGLEWDEFDSSFTGSLLAGFEESKTPVTDALTVLHALARRIEE